MDFRLIIVATAALVVHLVLAMGFKNCNSTAVLEHQTARIELEQENEQKLKDEEADLDKKLKEDYHISDLDLIAYQSGSIAETITGILNQLIPSTQRKEVLVTVDRFTGFRVYIKLANLPDKQVMAQWLKELFTRVSSQYVIELVITDGSGYRILGYYDLNHDRGSGEVFDWNKANLTAIMKQCFY